MRRLFSSSSSAGISSSGVGSIHLAGAPTISFPARVKIVEVGPRDGLQSEGREIPTRIKVRSPKENGEKKKKAQKAPQVSLIERLSDTGLQVVESTSFVSPKWVPQMRDGPEVMKLIKRRKGVQYPVLTPNLQGLEKAVEAGAEEVAIFASATESFSKRNINSTIAESLARYEPLAKRANELGIKGKREEEEEGAIVVVLCFRD